MADCDQFDVLVEDDVILVLQGGEELTDFGWIVGDADHKADGGITHAVDLDPEICDAGEDFLQVFFSNKGEVLGGDAK